MKRICVSGWDGRNGSITISGLEDGESEMFESAIGNCSWIMANENGRLISTPKYKPLPDPIEDEEMYPFWSLPKSQEKLTGQTTKYKDDKTEVPDGHSPQILISSLCGYYYSPENYKTQAEKLRSYGFECMRSKRDSSGKFIEHWYLYGYWAAKGNLNVFIKEIKQNTPQKEKLDQVIGFICRNVQFGSLEVAHQKAAMVIND